VQKPKDESKKISYQFSKELKKVEDKISKLESQIKALEESFFAIEYGTQEYVKSADQLSDLKSKLAEVSDAWEQLMSSSS
jgi:exonuclease VII small subunit